MRARRKSDTVLSLTTSERFKGYWPGFRIDELPSRLVIAVSRYSAVEDDFEAKKVFACALADWLRRPVDPNFA